MRGMHFHGQGNGGLEVVGKPEKGAIFWSRASGGGNSSSKRLKGGIREGLEPRSVLDNRRSPSPPTSSSTLSSSLGGGGGSSPTAGGGGGGGLAAVSDNPTRKWVGPDSSAGEVGGGGGAARKEEWASELQPVPAGLAVGGKCELGGVEDWESVLSAASAGGDAGQDQTFLRWIMGDVDDPSARQQLLSHGPAEFDGGNGILGFGLVDPGFGLEPIGGMSTVASVSASSISPPPPLASSVSSDGGLSLGSTNVNHGGSRISPSPPSPGLKAPTFGNQSGNNLFPPLPMNSLLMSSSLPPGMLSQEAMEEKPQLFGPSLLANQQQPAANPGFFLPLSSFTAPAEHQQLPHLLVPSQSKRHYSMVADPSCQIPPKLPFPDPSGGPDLFLRRNQLPPQPQQTQGFPQLHPVPYHLHQRSVKPKAATAAGDEAAAVHHQQQRQALFDQLFEAAKLIEVGNFASARGILARLNHQLPAPLGRPLLRSAFYFKEALGRILADTSNPLSSSTPLASSPFDVVLKLSAYKNFSEVSPVLQFTNFTCIQALLEELGSSSRIHIIDFDIGIGGQWSSFMQEVAQRRNTAAGAAVSMLKITAFVSHSAHHPLQLHLTRENLSNFAAELSIPFEFNILSLDSFHPSELLGMGGDEAIAVCLPLGGCSAAHSSSFPAILRLVKQLSPKIVVSVDQGCDRSDLPFSLHFLHAFQSCMVLLDSIDAAGTDAEVASKIERYLLQARIESAVLGRYRATEKMLPWRTLFASVGFAPMQISNYAEAQAECLLKRVQVRGFHVEKRQASLFLYWQRAELVSVSAWRC